MRLPSFDIERLKAACASKVPSQWRRPRIGVGLDVDGSVVRAIAVRHHAGAIRLLAGAVCPVQDPAQRTSLVDAIRRALEQIQFSSLKSPVISTAVRGSGTVVRFASFPAMTPKELKQSAQFEADKYIPFQINEVVLDSQAIGAPVQGKQEVLLVAAKKDLIEGHLQLLEEAGVAPHVIDLEAFALANAWEAAAASVPDETQVTALLSVGPQRCLLNIFLGTRLRLTRELPMGIGTESAATAVDGVVKQLRLSYDYFENQSGKSIDQLILTGAAVADTNFSNQLQTALSHPVQSWDPLAGLDKEPSFAQTDLGRAGCEMGVALGLGFRKVS